MRCSEAAVAAGSGSGAHLRARRFCFRPPAGQSHDLLSGDGWQAPVDSRSSGAGPRNPPQTHQASGIDAGRVRASPAGVKDRADGPALRRWRAVRGEDAAGVERRTSVTVVSCSTREVRRCGTHDASLTICDLGTGSTGLTGLVGTPKEKPGEEWKLFLGIVGFIAAGLLLGVIAGTFP